MSTKKQQLTVTGTAPEKLEEGDVFSPPGEYGVENQYRIDEKFLEEGDQFMATVERRQVIGGYLNKEYILTVKNEGCTIEASMVKGTTEVTTWTGEVDLFKSS